MTTYAIGDLHGCLDPLQRLLDKVRFDPSTDRVWLVGDLVNRGPQSLETLRFVKSLGDSCIAVLGNHDIHLLGVIHGLRKTNSKDTINDILRAPDLQELNDWLRHRPLLHDCEKTGFTLVHAGIHPAWTLKTAKKMANELEAHFRDEHYVEHLERLFGNKPEKWSNKLGARRRRRFALNVFTRMRYCSAKGTLDFSFNGAPAKAPKGLMPWYEVPKRKVIQRRILFGHWSSHPAFALSNVVPLDRGCVWGRYLTAVALETGVSNVIDCA